MFLLGSVTRACSRKDSPGASAVAPSPGVDADPLGDLVAGERASLCANVSAAAAGERGEPALDRLLAPTHGERRHQVALQREDTAFGDHRP